MKIHNPDKRTMTPKQQKRFDEAFKKSMQHQQPPSEGAKEQVTVALQALGVKVGDPCVRCGKVMRQDYSGFCMDCADEVGVSEIFRDLTIEQLQERIKEDMTEGEWFVKNGQAWGEPPLYAESVQIFHPTTGSGAMPIDFDKDFDEEDDDDNA